MSQIIVSDRDILVSHNQQEKIYQRDELPQDFLDWQCQSRIDSFKKMASISADSVRAMPAHLPVLASMGDEEFPINLASRGIGLLPKKEFLQYYCDLIENEITQIRDQLWQTTLSRRVAVIQGFYQSPEQIDPFLLGGLDIFEGQTSENLRVNPIAALLYSGEAPQFLSSRLIVLFNLFTPGIYIFVFFWQRANYLRAILSMYIRSIIHLDTCFTRPR